MKNKIIKLVALMLAICGALALASCSGAEKCRIEDDVYKDLNVKFALRNRTQGALYGDVWENGEDVPLDRTFVINTKEEFESIFMTSPFDSEVDFEKETVIVYTFTAVYHREIRVKSFKVNDNGATLCLEWVKPASVVGSGDASVPYQRCVAVRTAKLASDNVTVVME